MFQYNLIGYEDKFYSDFKRPKNLETHKKKIEEINNRKNIFKINSDNYKKDTNNSYNKKRKSPFHDACNDYNKEFSNYLLAKRLIDISNRDLAKSNLSHLNINEPFLQMKKSIKKNLDRFKENQIGKENSKMFKRLNNQSSNILPRINNTNQNKNNIDKVISRNNSSLSKNINSTNQSVNNIYNTDSTSKKKIKKVFINNNDEISLLDQKNLCEREDLVLPNIYLREIIANEKKNKEKIYYIGSEKINLLSSKNIKKKRYPEIDYIKFNDGMIII